MRESKSLALPFGDSPIRETGNVRDLSLAERSKINEKTTHDKTRLAELNRCCVTVTLSTVEHIGALSVQFGVCPIRRLHGIVKDGGQMQPKLSCVPATFKLYSKNSE